MASSMAKPSAEGRLKKTYCPDQQLAGFLRKLYRGVGSSRAKRYLNLLERGEWSSIQKDATADPRVYQNARVFFKDALVVEMTRKLLRSGDTAAAKAAAISTFYQAEADCLRTNARLRRFIGGQGPFEGPDLPMLEFIERWRSEVARILGPVPDSVTPRFSQGSTLSDHGKQTTLPDKLVSLPTYYAGSETSSFVLSSWNGTPQMQQRFKGRWRPAAHNEFFTVPKDSFKDRGCCMEASLMLPLQLGVGEVIAERYNLAYSTDLAYVQPYHQWLASVASRHGTFATIDLSNASDTVAAALVQLLLPTRWYTLLNTLRAKFTVIDGRRVKLEKFSSMGNGFTFPLETVIYQSLARTIGSCCSSTFGDDIVIESEHAPAMMAALRWFGFTPNSKKTFCEGPFRESCGGDYFDGTPVRAHYLKSVPTEPQHWVALANGLRRVDPDLTYCRAAWHYCIDQLPSAWLNYSADPSLEDGCIYNPDAKPRMHAFPVRDLFSAFGRVVDILPAWRAMVPIATSYDLVAHFNPTIAMIAASMGTPLQVPLRDSISGYRPSWTPAN